MKKIIILCLIFTCSGLIAEIPHEYDIKAAFIYNFTKFIQWPEQKNDRPFVVGVLGLNPFGKILENTVKSKTVKKKPVQIKYFSDISQITQCDILFISASEEKRLPIILNAIQNKNMLTIGDTKGYAEKGVMINFFTKENKIFFQINLKTVNQKNFHISSKLLNLAKIL